MAGGPQSQRIYRRVAFQDRPDSGTATDVLQFASCTRTVRADESRRDAGTSKCGQSQEGDVMKSIANKVRVDETSVNGHAGRVRSKKKMKRKEYEKELDRLHAELVKLQQWVVEKRLKVCIVFEGRDGAGKGGTIKAITERVSPRVFRVVALPAPTEREQSQMYVQRYVPHLRAAGEVVIFDRSWYNRAGVERVMGFCSEEQAQQFLQLIPVVERAIVDSGVIMVKYWLEVS